MALKPQSPQKPGIMARVAQAARFVITGEGGVDAGSSTWMSPMQPIAPIAPADVKARQWDYPVGVNLRYTPRSTELVGFNKLRALAENCNMLKIVMNRQKDLIEAFEWSIKPREETPGRRPAETKYKTEVDEITAFLKKPDRALDWGQWLRAVLEDLFVIDAVSLYRRPTLDGTRLWGLERIDGATITALVDGSGRIPQPPNPAYQQILKGVPAGDFSIDELVYFPKNPRTNRLYGESPVQMIIDTVETQIYRIQSQKAFFDAGNLTDGMFSGPEEWSTDQIKAWQKYWDENFAGDVSMRRQGIWVPFGTKFEAIKAPPLKDEFDEWLARVICFAFSTSPMPFVKSMNRGNQESQQEVAEEGGIATYMQFIKRLMDKVIDEDLGHPELEFCWSDDREFDPQVAAEMDDTRLKNGSRTENEIRDRNGDDPYTEEWADKPFIITPTGPVWLDVAYEQAQKQLAAPLPGPTDPSLSPGGPGGAGSPGPGGPPGGPAAKPAAQKAAPKAKPSSAPLKKSKREPIPLNSPTMKGARATLETKLDNVFAKLKADVQHQARVITVGMAKAAGDPDPDEIARQIAAALNLSVLETLPEAIEDALAAVAEAGGNLALVQLGVDEYAGLTGQVAQRALVFARARSAELVGKRWEDGALVDSPDARWAISEATRNMLRQEISGALTENETTIDVAQRISAIVDKIDSSYAFSKARSKVIAETEVARANIQGALEGAREARDAGVVLQKAWFLGQEPCDECLANAEQGPIDLDETFESGDDGPPAHPNCYCSVSWEVADDAVEKVALPARRFVAEWA